MNWFKVVVFLVFGFESYAQHKTILVFDLENGTKDSITDIQYDTTRLSDQTNYFLGTFNSLVEPLEQLPPVSNVYPGSQFTRKKKASSDFDITKYPIRTSVRIFSERNDTLHSNCSGSMISRRFVLTAAHCVSGINSDTLSFDSLYVCPVFDNGNFSNSFPCSEVQKIYIFKDWELIGEDFALLQLKEPIGELTGWISIGFNDSDSALTNGIYYKFTYPAFTIPFIDSAEYNGDTLYYNYGVADLVNKDWIGIDHTSGIPGESGSSLIRVENNHNYTSYGVLSFSTNLMHCKINNRQYYSLESIIHNDLIYGMHEDPFENIFTIYPNPAKDKIRIQNPGNSDISEIVIMDIRGGTVLRKPMNESHSSIDIKAIPEGVYLLIIKTGNSHFTKKLIILR